MGTRRFEGTLKRHGSGTVVVVPFDLKEEFGSGRPPVRATVNAYTFRTTLFTMGGRAGLNREVREAAGVDAGAQVSVTLERDKEPRNVAVPPDLAVALERDPAARTTLTGSPTRIARSTSAGSKKRSARRHARAASRSRSSCSAQA